MIDPPRPGSEWLTEAETAERLGTTPNEVRRLITSDRLKAAAVGEVRDGEGYRVKASEIDAFAKRNNLPKRETG